MVNKYDSITMKEKQIEMKKEEIMKQIGLPGCYTMLLHGQNKALFEITATTGSNLIPWAMKQRVIMAQGSEPKGESLPLHVAISFGHKEVVSFLIREYRQGSYAMNRANISPLYVVVEHHHLDLVKDMLHALVNDSDALAALWKGKSNAHAATKHQNKEMLRTILKYQRDLIKCTDEEGLTPVSYAAYNGFVDVVEYIIKK
ncbi:Ankyrin-1 [Bienertia sinuspersici]